MLTNVSKGMSGLTATSAFTQPFCAAIQLFVEGGGMREQGRQTDSQPQWESSSLGMALQSGWPGGFHWMRVSAV